MKEWYNYRLLESGYRVNNRLARYMEKKANKQGLYIQWYWSALDNSCVPLYFRKEINFPQLSGRAKRII